jgi:hypothetical protein
MFQTELWSEQDGVQKVQATEAQAAGTATAEPGTGNVASREGTFPRRSQVRKSPTVHYVDADVMFTCSHYFDDFGTSFSWMLFLIVV